MKLVSRLTTALVCSVITAGFGISSGDAETAIDSLGTKELLPKLVQLNRTLEPNKNKQNSVKQSTQEIVGSWIGTNSNGIEFNLLLQNDNSYIIIFSAPNGNWKCTYGTWSFSNNLLFLKGNDDTSTESVQWISNDEFVMETIHFRRTNQNISSLNQQLSGRWEIFENSTAGVGIREYMTSAIININSDGTFQYKKQQISPGFFTHTETNLAGIWHWFGDVLLIKDKGNGLIGKVRWISPNKFEYIQPSNKKTLLFERTS
jgi:hypothetical protein